MIENSSTEKKKLLDKYFEVESGFYESINTSIIILWVWVIFGVMIGCGLVIMGLKANADALFYFAMAAITFAYTLWLIIKTKGLRR